VILVKERPELQLYTNYNYRKFLTHADSKIRGCGTLTYNQYVVLYVAYYFSYNYIRFYIYVLDRILNKVSFSQSFLFIRRTCLALIIF
jgi:hypothetical protein